MAPTHPSPGPAREYGPRLTAEDYQRRVVALHEAASGEPDGDATLARREFELRLDHRLGTGFPAERRERLWAAHQAFERRRWLFLVRGLLPGSGGPSASLAAGLASMYASELDDDELAQCLGLEAAELARLVRR